MRYYGVDVCACMLLVVNIFNISRYVCVLLLCMLYVQSPNENFGRNKSFVCVRFKLQFSKRKMHSCPIARRKGV